jgi:hypothetical protein
MSGRSGAALGFFGFATAPPPFPTGLGLGSTDATKVTSANVAPVLRAPVRRLIFAISRGHGYRGVVRIFTGLLLAGLFGAANASAALPPLDAAGRAALAAIPADPAPPRLIKGQHYWVSNEFFPERFQGALSDLGGMFVGVGPEQSYFYAGWGKPEILVLADFDEVVVDLHRVYGAFFRAADDVSAFVALWDDPAGARRAIEAATDSPEERARLDETYRFGRKFVHARLVRARARYTTLGIATFLTDATQYSEVAALARGGRMHAVRGDLTGSKALSGIAGAARQLGVPVRMVYLSNVEQYFPYGSGLGANVLAQPGDDKSLVIRTFWGPGVKDDQYLYLVESQADMRGWLAQPKVRDMVDHLTLSKPAKRGETYFIPAPP